MHPSVDIRFLKKKKVWTFRDGKYRVLAWAFEMG